MPNRFSIPATVLTIFSNPFSPIFFLFKILTQRIELMWNDFAECGKENCVLAGFMRIIHAGELLHGDDELRSLGVGP